MKIIFLGTSHGNPEANRFCSSTALLVGGKCYLIDAGAPILQLLLTRNIRPETIGGIFITHAHDDHYLGLIEYTRVVNISREYKEVSTPVLVPKRSLYWEMLNLRYDWKLWHGKRGTKYKIYRKGVIFDDGNVKVTAIPVKHRPFSYAFMVEGEGKCLLFSGDLSMGMRDYPAVLYTKETDLLVLEGAHTVLNSPEIIEKINRSQIKQLVINHVADGKNPENEIKTAFSKVTSAKDCHIAYDGMEIEL